MTGPALQVPPPVFVSVDGLKIAVLPLPPIWMTSPLGSSALGPSSYSEVLESATGTVPVFTHFPVEGM